MGFKRSEAQEIETCKVLEKFGVLSEKETKLGKETKELRYVSWSGAAPKYDLRSWITDAEGNEKCKPKSGTTLSDEEAEKLYEILKQIAEEE